MKNLEYRWPIAGPSITELEIAAVTAAVKNDWYANANNSIQLFEQNFAKFTQRKYAIALPSCTAAIHLLLAALGISAEDEVIVPESTWIASAAPINYLGATTVMVDIEPQSWCIDPNKFAAAITAKTKAVIVVDLYGNMPAMQEILNIAKQHNIVVIEDAAEAIGSMYQQQPAGSFGNASVFSFHGSKTLTTGEGGMLVTDDLDLYKQCKILQDHGRQPGDTEFYNECIGYKYKMNAMTAALGNAQLQRLDELITAKKNIYLQYQEHLSFPGITLNFTGQPDNNLVPWMVTMLLAEHAKVTSSDLRTRLASHGVATRPFFHPLSSIPAYQPLLKSGRARTMGNRVASDCAQRGLNLPSALILDSADISAISAIIIQELGYG